MSRLMTKDDIERFWASVQKGADNECWLWAAGRTGRGYGAFYIDGKQMPAHRFSMMIKANHPLPDGWFVLHSCDNPPCVNPRHLRLGTQKENVADAIERNRHKNPPPVPSERPYEHCARGTQIHTAKLNEWAVRDLLKERLTGRNFTDLGQEFGLDATTVADICKGKGWSHVHGTWGAPTLAELAAVPIVYNCTPHESVRRKLSDEQVAEIRASPLGCVALARIYGVTKGTTSKIKLGQYR
jgi:hypothetical protein